MLKEKNLTFSVKIAKLWSKKIACAKQILFRLNQSWRRMDMDSKRLSIEIVVPLVLGLSNEVIEVPKLENILHIPDPELSDADRMLTFLARLTIE